MPLLRCVFRLLRANGGPGPDCGAARTRRPLPTLTRRSADLKDPQPGSPNA